MIAGTLMVFTIMIEVSLYITKSFKCDLITQKAQKVKKATEQRRFDTYYEGLKKKEDSQNDFIDDKVSDVKRVSEALERQLSEFEVKERSGRLNLPYTIGTDTASIKKEK